MKIIAENIGKRFSKEWIFRNLTFTVAPRQSLAITGSNGSGKSTLLQLLAGSMPSSEGTIHYQQNETNVPGDDFYKYIAYAAPYLELVEEMTLRELVQFHQKFKPFTEGLSTDRFIDRIFLESSADKPIRFLSSGMKQRVKLGLALFSDTPVLFLDEPTTNLDDRGIEWYLEEIQQQLPKRTILIGSNQRHEYSFCDQEINIRK